MNRMKKEIIVRLERLLLVILDTAQNMVNSNAINKVTYVFAVDRF